ncbi:MAG: tetratricopeptide repeat protein [Cyanobacteria bacterium J06621_11]
MSAPLLNHRYRIIKALAEGGFGKTFLVEDTQMPSRRQCVIKQLKPMNDRPEVFKIVQERFSREAAVLEAVGKGNHQIPDLYAYFEEGGQFYLVQEWIEGEALVSLVHEDWPEDRVQALLTGSLQALAGVHRQNIIHRDIKPDNIILRKEDNLPCLIDFGAVKELMSTVVRQSGATQSSLVIGTPGFMPPEQAAGRPTFSSDLYSLSMTIIFLLTKRSPAELPSNSQTGEVLWTQFAPNVSERLQTILSRAIHPYTQNRYPTADAMLAALPPNTVEQPPTEVSLSPHGVGASSVPTVAAAAVPYGTPSRSQPISQPMISQPPEQSTTQQPHTSTSSGGGDFPWKQVGIAVGTLLLAGSVLIGVRPKLSFENRSSLAQVEDFPAAIKSLEASLEDEPTDTAAQVELANAYYHVGNYEAAITQAEAVIAEEPENTAASLSKAQVQFEKGDYQGVIETLTQAIDADSSSAKAFVERGNAYSEIGEYDNAVEDYRRALQIDADYGLAYQELSYVDVIKGNTQEALQNLDLAIENGDRSIYVYTNRGNRKEELGNREGAAEDWETASEMEAYTARDFSSRGYAKSRLNKKASALDDYNQALIVNPNSVRAIINRAYLQYESGELEQAIATTEKALAINPNSTTALILLGEMKSNSNPADQEGALEDYSKALEVNPNDPNILNNRCSAYFATAQLDLALTDCDRGLQINPRSEALYIGRGNIRLVQENYDKAVQDFSRSLEIIEESGGNPFREATAYSNRASALVGLQDLNGALADLNKALELSPDDAPDLYKRGLIKSSLGDKAGAQEDMRRAADIYLQQGRTDSHKNVIETMEQLGL